MTPKPEKAWAVFKPNGKVILYTVAKTRDDSIFEYKSRYHARMRNDWYYYYGSGYRCLPVVITPVKKG